MANQRQAPHTASRGFTMVEMMVTVAIISMILTIVYSTFFRAQGNAQRMNALVESRQNARAACQLIEREVRMAGSGWGRLACNINYSGQQFQVTPIDPGYAGANSDTLSIIGGFVGNATKLRATMSTCTTDIPVQSISGFSVGDLVVVTSGASAHLFQVTGTASSPAVLRHASSSPWNPASSYANWPPGGYGVNAEVYKSTWTQYRFDPTTFTRPSLVRIENNGLPQVVAQTVVAFEVWYLMQDGTLTRNPLDWTSVDRVRPLVRISYESGNGTVNDSVWAIAKPRTF